MNRLSSSEGKIKAMSLWEDISLSAHRVSMETRCAACLSAAIKYLIYTIASRDRLPRAKLHCQSQLSNNQRGEI